MKSEVGGCSAGKSFRSVRACVPAVWLPSGIGSQIPLVGLFPFPFGPCLVVGLFLFWAGWSWGGFPFPFWAWELSLFPSPTPQTSYPTSVGLIRCDGFGNQSQTATCMYRLIVQCSGTPPGWTLCGWGSQLSGLDYV